MLYSGSVIETTSQETLKVSMTRGCLQGAYYLSPLLWSLVVDTFLRQFNEKGYYAIGHADDIAILKTKKFPQTVSEVLKNSSETNTAIV
jgi:hypothetical protein